MKITVGPAFFKKSRNNLLMLMLVGLALMLHFHSSDLFSPFNFIPLVVGGLFFCVSIVMLYLSFFKKHYIEITNIGLKCQGTYNQLIPWCDIRSLKLKLIGRTHYLLIDVIDQEKYYQKIGVVKKFSVGMMSKKVGVVFWENLLPYNEDPAFILKQCLDYK